MRTKRGLYLSTPVAAAAAIAVYAALMLGASPRDDGSERTRRTTPTAPASVGSHSRGVGVDLASRPLPLVPPGTKIGDQPPEGWTHLVLHGVPRVAEGDVNEVSSLVARMASLVHLTILARTKRDPFAETVDYTLDEVAIGLAVSVGDQDVVISSATQESLGAGLDFIERSVLSENEAFLVDVRQVARTPTMVVFDAPAIVLRGNEHRDMVHRHAVVVSPEDGKLASFVWLLDVAAGARGAAPTYQLAEPSIELLPEGMHEDRTLHVDADEFIVGVPTKRAFALVGIPRGKKLALPENAQQAAAAQFRDPRQVQILESALRAALGWSG